jgi:hypothetical protein
MRTSGGYFCDGMPFRSYLSEGHKLEWRYGTLFPDIGITNTSPSLTEFLVNLRIPEPVFLEK